VEFVLYCTLSVEFVLYCTLSVEFVLHCTLSVYDFLSMHKFTSIRITRSD
jgi:hypothetical protein